MMRLVERGGVWGKEAVEVGEGREGSHICIICNVMYTHRDIYIRNYEEKLKSQGRDGQSSKKISCYVEEYHLIELAKVDR